MIIVNQSPINYTLQSLLKQEKQKASAIQAAFIQEKQKMQAAADQKDSEIQKLKTLLNKGRMYSLGEMNFIQGMLDFGNPKNSVGLKPNAELRKDAKAPSIPKS